MALGLLLANCVSWTCLCTLGWAFSLGWAKQGQAGLGPGYPKHASGHGSHISYGHFVLKSELLLNINLWGSL